MCMSENIVKLETYAKNKDMRIEHEGKTYFSLEGFGVLCGYSPKNALEIYDKHPDFFNNEVIILERKGNLSSAVTTGVRPYGSKPYLTSVGLYIWVSKLEITRLDESRQKFIISAVHYMAESAVMRDQGKLVLKEQDTLEWKDSRNQQIKSHNIMNTELKENDIPKMHSEKGKLYIYKRYVILIHTIVFGYHENEMRLHASKDEIKAIDSLCEWIGTLSAEGIGDYAYRKAFCEKRFQKHFPELYAKRELLKIERNELKLKLAEQVEQTTVDKYILEEE